jgi:hypothetical protein
MLPKRKELILIPRKYKLKFLLDANLFELQNKFTLSTITYPGKKYDFSKFGGRKQSPLK